VPEAISLARATLTVIRRNLAWAFGYNIAAIPLAAAGFLDPLIAGAAMAASSAFVVASSIRLRRFAAVAPPRRARPAAPEVAVSVVAAREVAVPVVAAPEVAVPVVAAREVAVPVVGTPVVTAPVVADD
jgi:hypothetical protein